ncbi:leucine-rich repeat-containing protein 41 isoform X1 [Eublepharis macularius]|uniref:Leucine-rich repeat-containing protein 41 n=1 Tax=Eublepharis macularius TaxID=481883 RepID=A0AA97L2K7_EUBMA|nr:leucine-rich repeat-containing protein 41 isoform X1 [Eublepharis macularius]
MEAKYREKVADRNPPSLFDLSGAVVTSVMRQVEREVWALPGPILQNILPMLNIYYLERIEETAVKKGLSTQTIWCKLWCDIMKTRPSRFESVKCWRKKFLEAFFSNVLRGTLDLSSDQRLRDPCFLPLLYTSQHVTQLTIYNMLEGVAELMAKHNQGVLENLVVSLRSLTFRHLLSSSQSTKQQLSLLLHRLIHHGAVNHVSMNSWPNPDSSLLVLILKMSAGIWHPGKTLVNQASLCHLCREALVDQSQKLDQEHVPHLDSSRLFHGLTTGHCSDKDLRNEKLLSSMPLGFENAIELARASSETLNISADSHWSSSPFQSKMQHNTSSESHNSEKGSVKLSPAKLSQDGYPLDESQKKGKGKLGYHCRTRKANTDSEDLYDFVFAVAREEEEKTLLNKRTKAKEEKAYVNSSSYPTEVATGTAPNLVHRDRAQPIGITSLKTASHFRSVSTLEILSIRLNRNTCQMLGNLLSSWISLEKLVLSLNGLGPNIFSILSGLRALSRHNDYHLRVVHISDMLSHVPCMNLVHSVLSAVPLLQVLTVSFDLKTLMEWSRTEESSGSSSLDEDIPESHLENLEIRFPREPLQTSLLIPVLKASMSLQSLSLDSVAISCPQEVELLLHALKDYCPVLKRLSFHDINLSHHAKDVLLLLQDPILQEITFSFCRLFENCNAEFLSEIINAVKKNSSLKTLKLPGNRLGNHRLIALADIFSEDSSTSICHLDVSSNCIKPDGLLEFAKKLESYIAQRGEQIKFTKLCLSQNWLDQDAVTAQEALWRLKAICSVVSDTWDSSQAFADYVSMM